MSNKLQLSLRPYQEQSISSIETAFKRGARSVLLVACTGAGKTIISSALMTDRFLRKKKCIFLAHREELLVQTVEKMAIVNKDVCVQISQGQNHTRFYADVMVASVQTIYRDLARIKEFTKPEDLELCITDECHHALAPIYRKVYDFLADWAPNCKLLGITATPKRSDGNLHSVFSELAYQVNMFDLIDQGFLTPIRGVTIESTISLRNVKTVKGLNGETDYDERTLRLTVDCPVRNKLIIDAYLKYGEGRKVVFFTVNIGHAKNLEALLISAGVKAATVSGAQPREERKKILKDYKEGRIWALLNCALLIEGFDDPTLECVVVARPTKSPILYPQMVGRGVRLNPKDPNKTCLVIDIVDRDALETQTLSGLFELPPKLKLMGEEMSKMRKEARAMIQAHPFIDWKVGQSLDRPTLMTLLAPSTLFDVAQGITQVKGGRYLWQRTGEGKWAICTADSNWSTIEKTPLGNYTLRVESSILSTIEADTDITALELAGNQLVVKFPTSAFSFYYPSDVAFYEKPTTAQTDLLANKFKVPHKELKALRSKGQASLIISKLMIAQRMCKLDYRFPSGKYFSFSIPFVILLDTNYIEDYCKTNLAVTYFTKTPANFLSWVKLVKPEAYQAMLNKHTEAELLTIARDYNQLRQFLVEQFKDDFEYKALESHITEHNKPTT